MLAEVPDDLLGGVVAGGRARISLLRRTVEQADVVDGAEGLAGRVVVAGEVEGQLLRCLEHRTAEETGQLFTLWQAAPEEGGPSVRRLALLRDPGVGSGSAGPRVLRPRRLGGEQFGGEVGGPFLGAP